MELKNLKESSVGPTLVPLTELEQALDETQHWLDDLVSPFARAKHEREQRNPSG